MTTRAVLLGMPGNEALVQSLARHLDGETGQLELRTFPDGETYLRVHTPVAGRAVVLACSLDRPDGKLVPLYLLASTLRALGAARIVLVAPYIPYMRQDQAFHAGESVSARHIGHWLSSWLDGLITVDPHLHRIEHLADVYQCATRVVAAAPSMAAWIRAQVRDPVLIGPDSESAQWVSEVARDAGCPFTVLTKTRRGDRDVEVSVPEVARWRQCTPVLVDDIISTGHTMLAAAAHLRDAGLPLAVGVGVHAVFAGDAYRDLLQGPIARIVTCNTIAHPSNGMDVHSALAAAVTDSLGAVAYSDRSPK